nr:putative ribonuclease H-like domain-containing protein [Tanacetum cinerariifolium]
MRVEIFNGKKYVLVIIDDYSRYTWTHFLRSKDETPKVLIDFLKLVQRGLHAQVRTVRTDKGTKFLNKTLHAYFAQEGIEHKTLTTRPPKQNGVVKRQNHTLVDAAQTMLSAAKVPLFFWAEAIATALWKPGKERMSTMLSSDATFSMKMFPFGHCPERNGDVSSSQMKDHTCDWLRAVPISGLGHTMNSRLTRDIYRDHAVSCVGIVDIKHRHNVVRDTLVDICYRSGISSGKEVDIGLGGERDKSLCPADVFLYSWDGGCDVCIDLIGSSPLTQTRMVDFVSGHVVLEATQRKRIKYEAKCADIGYGFLPFSFSSFGELEKDVVTLLKRIQKFSVA